MSSQSNRHGRMWAMDRNSLPARDRRQEDAAAKESAARQESDGEVWKRKPPAQRPDVVSSWTDLFLCQVMRQLSVHHAGKMRQVCKRLREIPLEHYFVHSFESTYNQQDRQWVVHQQFCSRVPPQFAGHTEKEVVLAIEVAEKMVGSLRSGCLLELARWPTGLLKLCARADGVESLHPDGGFPGLHAEQMLMAAARAGRADTVLELVQAGTSIAMKESKQLGVLQAQRRLNWRSLMERSQ